MQSAIQHSENAVAKTKIDPISGFPEWLPNVRMAEQKFIATIQRQYELFGFASIETPAVERWDQRDIFIYREVRKQSCFLNHISGPTSQTYDIPLCGWFAFNQDLSGGWRQQTID